MFAGIYIRNSRKHLQDFASEKDLLGGLAPYDNADVKGSWYGNRVLLVQSLIWNTKESKHEAVPHVCRRTGCVIVSWVRLDNRAYLCVELGLDNIPTLTDPEVLLFAYEKWGKDCVDRLEGDFSFVIYNPANDTLFCARDCVGAKPLFYYVDDTVCVFATTAAIFPRIRNIDNSICQHWLARYFVNVSHHRVKTAFTGVVKLPSAHHFEVCRSGSVSPSEYFSFKNRAPFATTRDSKWVTQHRAIFDRAVGARLRSDYLVGAETSGGIDSSTIIASASKQLIHPKKDFHLFGLSHLSHEPEYILETSIHCGIEQNHIYTSPSYYRDDDIALRGIRTLGYPAENGLTTLYHRFMEEAQLHGIRTMLSGFGGDEVITSKGEVFSEELYRAGAWKTLLDEFPGVLPMRMARFATFVGRDILKNRNQQAMASPFWQRILEFVTPEACAEFELAEMAAVRPVNITEPGMNALALTHLTDWRFGGEMTARLESFSLIAQSYGISYRWPMLDRSLIQQFLDTPTIEKRHKSYGRYLHRKAFAGELPEKILWKPTKSMGMFAKVDHQDLSFVKLVLDDLPVQLTEIVVIDAILTVAERMDSHRLGVKSMPMVEYWAGLSVLKNLMELRLFIREWFG